ncbi:MAG: M20/M25/M40 family metallo-hydrolase [Cyanobacteriota bacterium]
MYKKIKKFSLAVLIATSISLNSYSKNTDIYTEAIDNLKEYLKINTTNPPGNEIKTAKFLKKLLDKEGIENKFFDLGNNRANVYAILRGDNSKKPIIMLHHMDVVPADKKYWKVDPFSAKVINGELYGRGAIDIKGKGIVDLMTMIQLKRSKVKLKRDYILLAVADEEVNSIGSKWFIKNKPELIKNAEYLIDEGESIKEDDKGNILYAAIGVGEKSPLWLTLTFTGKPGHGSVPFEDSAVNKAIKTANRILEYSKKIDFSVIEGLEENIKLQYKGDFSKLKGYDVDIKKAMKNKDFLEELAKNTTINALLRNTISITGMKGSDKINTIPNEASLSLDCRLIPGNSKDDFLLELKKVINDNSVKIKIEEFYNAKYTKINTEYIKVLEKVINKRKSGTKVIPTIFTSSTDSSLYRELGINVYGFESYKITEDISETAHGNNERIKIDNIKFGIDLLLDTVKELNK